LRCPRALGGERETCSANTDVSTIKVKYIKEKVFFGCEGSKYQLTKKWYPKSKYPPPKPSFQKNKTGRSKNMQGKTSPVDGAEYFNVQK